MPTHIIVLADTHVSTLRQLPERLTGIIREAGWVVHCGDYTGIDVVRELKALAPQFTGVYGNTDSSDVRELLPAAATFEVEGKRIAVIHPYWGGPPWGLEEELLAHFPHADAILYGHTHDARVAERNGILLLNPGQGYPSFIAQASIGVLRIDGSGITGRVFPLDQAYLF